MSWTDKELSDMANASQAEQKFAYNDAYFAEVEAMLPKKKKRLFPFFTLPLIPMMGILAYIGMYQPESTTVANSMDTESTYLSQNFESISESSRFLPSNESELPIKNNSEITTSTDQFDTKSTIQPFVQATTKQIEASSAVANSPLKIVKNTTIILEDKIDDGLDFSTIKTFESNELTLTPNPKEFEVAVKRPIGFENINPLSTASLVAPVFANGPATEAFTRLSAFTPRKTWSMYVEAGVGMGESYLTSQVGHTQLAQIGAGARYDFKNTFVQLGVAGEFQKVQMEISDRAKIYHSSSTNFENVMDYKQLYRLQMPFTFGYKIHKHSIQASLIPSYLLGAKMNYTYLENGQELRNETLYNQRKGWNDFSTSLGLGYGYQVAKGLTLGANVNCQFMNQVNKNEVSEGNKQPFSGQVFIRKSIK